jgi:hypothetical protein
MNIVDTNDDFDVYFELTLVKDGEANYIES